MLSGDFHGIVILEVLPRRPASSCLSLDVLVYTRSVFSRFSQNEDSERIIADNRQLAQTTGAIAQKELNTSAIRLIGIANICVCPKGSSMRPTGSRSAATACSLCDNRIFLCILLRARRRRSGQESINYAIINEKLTADGFSTAELEAVQHRIFTRLI